MSITEGKTTTLQQGESQRIETKTKVIDFKTTRVQVPECSIM